jgi:hypothetical protein
MPPEEPESIDFRCSGQVLTSIMFLSLRRMAIVLLIVAGGAETSFAQTPACDRWRAEFASLRAGGGQRSGAAAQQVGAELSRTINYARQFGCDRGRLFAGAPPECSQLNARINQLQSQYSQLQGQAQPDGNAERRAQLAGLIDTNCQGRGVYQTPPPLPVGASPRQQQPRRERTFFEALFGIEPSRETPLEPIDSTLPELDPNAPPEEKGIRFGAGMPVCVRTCDGYFFPLSNSPGGRENQAEMCAALCPSAEMQVFYMSGNGNIDSAVGRGGQSYSSLPNAGKYTRSFDPTCGCRKQGESWIVALRDAERMLDRQRGDVIVTQAKSDELSKPRAVATPRRPKNAPAAPTPAPAPAAEAIPTAGTESSGIGSQDSVGADTLGQGLGLRRDITGANGEKKSIRIVAPNLAPQRQIQ